MKIYFLLMCLFLSFTIQAKDKIKVVSFCFPPHVICDGAKKPFGPTIDVWEKQIAPNADVEIEWVGPVPFIRAMDMVEKGEADAFTFIVSSPDRQIKYLYPKKNHIEGKQGLVVLASEPLSGVTTIDQLKDKAIGKLGAGYIPKFFEENKAAIKFEEVNADNSAEVNMKKIIAGRIWAGYFVFADTLTYWAAKTKELSKIKIIGFPGSEGNMKGYPAMSRKLNPEVAKRIEAAIEKTAPTYNYVEMTEKFLKSL